MKPYKQKTLYFSPLVPVRVRCTTGPMPGYKLNYHPEYEFQLIKKGHGAYYIEGKTYYFGPRQLVTILPGQLHSYIALDESLVVEKNTLLFHGKWLKNFPQLADIDKAFPALITLSASRFRSMEMIIKGILKENLNRKPDWEEMIRKLLHEFVIMAAKYKSKTVSLRAKNPLFVQLCQYIESHCADPRCNVTNIAAEFGYSLSHISAFFIKTSGISMKQYMLQCKINAACKVLADNPNLKIESVAKQVGFNLYRDFVRIFFKLTGEFPSTYRNKSHAS